MSGSWLTSTELILLTCMAMFVHFSFFPIIEKYSLYLVFHNASDQMHGQSEFPDFRPTCRTIRGGLQSSPFRKIMQQYILPLEYANSANFLLLEAISQLDDLSKKDYSVNLSKHLKENPSRGSFGASYKLETRLLWKLAPCFLLIFYNNIKFAGQWDYLLYLGGLPLFLDLLMGFHGVSVGFLKVSGVALKVNGVDLRWGSYRG